jgi:hypothetical protein
MNGKKSSTIARCGSNHADIFSDRHLQALHIIYGDKLADDWVSLPNKNAIFAGRTPLQYMLSGGLMGMKTVRKLLDARRSGV